MHCVRNNSSSLSLTHTHTLSLSHTHTLSLFFFLFLFFLSRLSLSHKSSEREIQCTLVMAVRASSKWYMYSHRMKRDFLRTHLFFDGSAKLVRLCLKQARFSQLFKWCAKVPQEMSRSWWCLFKLNWAVVDWKIKKISALCWKYWDIPNEDKWEESRSLKFKIHIRKRVDGWNLNPLDKDFFRLWLLLWNL